MRVVFRADASLQIGTGHVMRCLALADALQAEGGVCHFICREHTGHLMDLVRQRGHTVHSLSIDGVKEARATDDAGDLPAHALWLGGDWRRDAIQTRAVLARLRPDWLVVDHYALDISWEGAVRGDCGGLMVIDDLADRRHDCDLLLDQTLGRRTEDYCGLVPIGCTILAGPKYALLRPEFAALREYSLKRREAGRLDRVLVSMGGVDQLNATEEVLKALKECPLPTDCHITVVMGPHAPYLDSVKRQAATMPWPTDIRVNVSNMAQIMADCDLAIGAAGSTSWERCCLGIPTIMLVLAANQKEAAGRLEAAGAALVVKSPESIATQVLSACGQVISQPNLLAKLARSASCVTEGTGIGLVQKVLDSLRVEDDNG